MDYIKFFADTKYKSFLKQMSVYGFEKLGERNDWCFYHKHFHRDFPDDLIYITRVKSCDEPSFEATQRKKIYQTMLLETGNCTNINTSSTKVDSATDFDSTYADNSVENTMK